MESIEIMRSERYYKPINKHIFFTNQGNFSGGIYSIYTNYYFFKKNWRRCNHVTLTRILFQNICMRSIIIQINGLELNNQNCIIEVLNYYNWAHSSFMEALSEF